MKIIHSNKYFNSCFLRVIFGDLAGGSRFSVASLHSASAHSPTELAPVSSLK